MLLSRSIPRSTLRWRATIRVPTPIRRIIVDVRSIRDPDGRRRRRWWKRQCRDRAECTVSGLATGPTKPSAGQGWRPTTADWLKAIATGDNNAGNGGDGNFYGGLVHATFAFYYPINIAVAGYNSSAHAKQTNNVVFDQSAHQMAGVGGDGGNGNAAIGGSADIFSSVFDLIGSDVIATGHNSAGNGGNGHFSGSLVDINVAIYAPINIAVAGYNSTAEADQSNNVSSIRARSRSPESAVTAATATPRLAAISPCICCRIFICWITA